MRTFFQKFAILLIVFACGTSFAQYDYTAKSELDSNHILIGDQLKLHVSIRGENYKNIIFPYFCDTCIQGIEVVKRSKIDTLRDKNNISLSQYITITSFDSGKYLIPSLVFYNKDSDTLAYTQAIELNVNTIPVDTTLAIKDIKNPMQVPLTWKEISKYILLSIGGIAFITGIILLFYRLNSKKKKVFTKPLKPKEAAHVIALRDLEALRVKKLWQSGEYKLYYSELCDILRIYLYNRWNISAMEMVSDEILVALSKLNIESHWERKIQYTLQIADTVKFAKATPLPDENSSAFQNIYEFIDATKAVENQSENLGGKKDA